MKIPLNILLFILLVIGGCLSSYERPDVKVNRFQDLAQEGVTIASCDPSHCPAGRYTYMTLVSLEIKDPVEGARLRSNIITNDPNVRAVLDKVVSGEVDAGFVYITDARQEPDGLEVIEIPTDISPLPQYGLAAVKDSPNPEGARQFMDFIMSKDGQDILKERGFLAGIDEPDEFEYDHDGTGDVITVYAASSLTDAFTDAAKEFTRKTGVEVKIGFGSSGVLRGKIEGGAPADVFATASLRHAEMLIDQGLSDGYEVFARNHLVVVTPKR